MYCLWQGLSHGTIFLPHKLGPWNLTYFWKKLTLVITFSAEVIELHIVHVYCLWQDLSHGTVIFDLVILTLKFDLFLKSFNHGFYLIIVAARRASLSSDNSYWQMWYANRGRLLFRASGPVSLVTCICCTCWHQFFPKLAMSWFPRLCNAQV